DQQVVPRLIRVRAEKMQTQRRLARAGSAPHQIGAPRDQPAVQDFVQPRDPGRQPTHLQRHRIHLRLASTQAPAMPVVRRTSMHFSCKARVRPPEVGTGTRNRPVAGAGRRSGWTDHCASRPGPGPGDAPALRALDRARRARRARCLRGRGTPGPAGSGPGREGAMGIDERGSTAGGGGAVVAYFSMEVGLEPDMPTYAGGLGILAGDTLRAAADLCLPVVGVTLVHRQGYFRQELSDDGWQSEHPVPWAPERRLEPVGVRGEIPLEGRPVHIRAWRHTVRGATGHTVALLLLDTDLPENAEEHRGLTDHLYGGDARYRLCQEAVLGLGGVAMLRALGWRDVAVYHMNEGHSALLALALLEELEAARAGDGPPDREALEAVRRRCVFTTHTPVAAGHDRFPMDLVRHVLGQERAVRLERAGCAAGGELDMTRTALRLSGFVNGVAMRHREVTRKMFPEHRIGAITNGVHAVTWTSPAMRAVFDRHIPEWRVQNGNLRYAVEIPLEEIVEAHRASRIRLLEEIERRIGRRLDPDALTIGFARRAAPYKRVTLAFTDPER